VFVLDVNIVVPVIDLWGSVVTLCLFFGGFDENSCGCEIEKPIVYSNKPAFVHLAMRGTMDVVFVF